MFNFTGSGAAQLACFQRAHRCAALLSATGFAIMAPRDVMNTSVPLEITPRELKQKLDAQESVQLIDVREPQEYALARLENAELIPMRAIPQALDALRKKAAAGPLVIYCHHGVRSLQAVSWLRRQGFPECRSLQGGIDRWSITTDPSIPRY